MYAGFWRRFFAYIIDMVILWVPFGPLYYFTYIAPVWQLSMPEQFAMSALVNLIMMTTPLLYSIVFESSKLQATPGKLVLGIKVTDMEGNRLTFWKATARTVCKFISGLTILVGYMMAAFTTRKQALHDKLSNTLVVGKNTDVASLQPLPEESMLKKVLISATGVFIFIVGMTLYMSAIFFYLYKAEGKAPAKILPVMGEIKNAQIKYGAGRDSFAKKYAASMNDLDITVEGARYFGEENAVFVKDGFLVKLEDNRVTSQRIGSPLGFSYAYTVCYNRDRMCCTGAAAFCPAGSVSAYSQQCCVN